jgi:hypothetical protein
MTANNPQRPPKLPGNGLLGWLGRQVAYIRKAMKTDVAASKTVYRDCRTEEMPLPEDPKVKLRRTVIDEVVVDRDPGPSAQRKAP